MYQSESILKNNELEKIIKERNQKAEIDENKEVVIYGCGKLGKFIYNNSHKSKINVKYFIDNKEYVNENYKGVKIYSLNDFVKNYNDELVIIGSILCDADMEVELYERGITNVISYSTLSEVNKNRFSPHDLGYIYYTKDLLENSDKYIRLFSEINDELSLKVLDNIIMFRITMNKKYLVKACELSKSKNGQYFDENIVKLSSDEVFIDGGGYKGETTKQFLELVSNKYKRIEIFEPDKDLCKDIIDNIKGENINYNMVGLGRREEILKFNKTGFIDGYISEDGKYKIQVNSIDNFCIQDPPTFIKLDIEGSELDAIYGAKQTIRRYKPKMAICSYHKAEDLWQLFFAIKSINNNYDTYVRQYSKSYWDTNFYYI